MSLLPCKDEFIILPPKDSSDGKRGAQQPVLPLKCPAESLRETGDERLAKCRMGIDFLKKTRCYIERPPPPLDPKELSYEASLTHSGSASRQSGRCRKVIYSKCIW